MSLTTNDYLNFGDTRNSQSNFGDNVSQEPLVQICGKVIRNGASKKETGYRIVDVYVFGQQKKYQIIIPNDIFCPVSEGDGITATCTYRGNKLLIKYPPFVEIGVDRETVVHCFIKALRGTGIGNIKAQKLYNAFSKQAAKHVEEDEKLTDDKRVVSYITSLAYRYMGNRDTNFFELYSDLIKEKQMVKLLKWWYKQRSLRRLYLLGLTNKEIRSIRRLSLDQIYDKAIQNPFVIPEIPITKCLSIMKRLGKNVTQEDLRKGDIIRKIYDYNSRNGWVGIPIERISNMFNDFSAHVDGLYKEYGIKYEVDTVYLEYPEQVEKEMAEYYKNIINNNKNSFLTQPNFMRNNLTDEQKEAVHKAINYKLSIITGSPGSGKTLTISEIIHNLDLQDIKYAIVSFTGKAVSRLREVIGKKDPSTMHKMISKNTCENFKHLIIDEVSMVTLELFYEFVKTFKHEFAITLVGDINQLRPISWGNMFSELLKTDKVPITYLTKIHRVVRGFKENGILINSKNIIDYSENKSNCKNKFALVPTENFQIIDCELEYIYDVLNALKKGSISCNDVTIICPYNKYLSEINSHAQQIFNDGNEYIIDSRGKCWMVGDRVMMAVNNYDINIMNGEEGIINEVSLDEGTIDVDFKGHGVFKFKLEPSKIQISDVEWQGFYDGESFIENEELSVKQLNHSFCITTHRSQGSEWDYIIFYVPNHKANEHFLNRTLIYTAITRAKIAVWCIGDIEAIVKGAITDPKYKCDNLCKRILLE